MQNESKVVLAVAPVQIIELILQRAGGIAALATLGIAMLAILRSLRRPPGRAETGAQIALRPLTLVLATVLFLALAALLWRPVPLDLTPSLSAFFLVLGATCLFGGLFLYLWGLSSLGQMFALSSGFGVRLHSDHRLVTSGPFKYVRHPMYLAVIAAAIGSLLLYRTWAALLFAFTMPGLIVRGRREDRVLAQEFGPDWHVYSSEVPAWLPRLRKKIVRRV